MAAIISHLEAVAVVKKWFTAVEFSIYLSDCLVRWVVVVGRLKDGMEAIVDAAHIRSLGWRMALIFNNAAMCQTYQSEEEEEGYLPELVKYMNMIFFFPPTAAGSGWSYIYIYSQNSECHCSGIRGFSLCHCTPAIKQSLWIVVTQAQMDLSKHS